MKKKVRWTLKWIVLSGIDGSGKTSVLNGIKKELTARNLIVSEQWLRFHHITCKVLHAIARCIGLSRKQAMTEGGAWRHEFYRSRFFCFVYVRCTYIDTMLGRYQAIRRANKIHADVVLCDRWIPDILIDLAVATRNPDILTGIWKERFLKMLPADTLLFCINRSEHELLNCRTENREDSDFSFRLDMYKEWMRTSGTVVIDNHSTVDTAVATAFLHIEKEFML